MRNTLESVPTLSFLYFVFLVNYTLKLSIRVCLINTEDLDEPGSKYIY